MASQSLNVQSLCALVVDCGLLDEDQVKEVLIREGAQRQRLLKERGGPVGLCSRILVTVFGSVMNDTILMGALQPLTGKRRLATVPRHSFQTLAVPFLDLHRRDSGRVSTILGTKQSSFLLSCASDLQSSV